MDKVVVCSPNVEVIELLGKPCTLTPPDSIASVYDVIGVGEGNPNRACMAAFGLCYRGGSVAWPRGLNYRAFKFEPLAYGGAVFDHLVSLGISPADALNAGVKAYSLLARALPSSVEEQVGNSDAPEDSTSPPSR